MAISKCWKAILHLRVRSKYWNIKSNWYDSQKEANRAYQLKLMEKAGKIQNLRQQIHFLLQEWFRYNGKAERKIEYVADFVYDKDGKMIVEDVKSPITKKNPVYRIKRKLLLNRYPYITFIET